MITLIACSKTASHPYSLQTPIAQSGPQSILLGQAIDINSADVAALEALPSIGPALAQRIIAYRSAHGPFASVSDLRNVSGIGEVTLHHLAPLIQTSPKF